MSCWRCGFNWRELKLTRKGKWGASFKPVWLESELLEHSLFLNVEQPIYMPPPYSPVLRQKAYSEPSKYHMKGEPPSRPWQADQMHRKRSFAISLFESVFTQFHGPSLQTASPSLWLPLLWPLRFFMGREVISLEPRPSSWDYIGSSLSDK